LKGQNNMDIAEIMQAHFVRKVANPGLAIAHERQRSVSSAIGQMELAYKSAERKVFDPNDDPAFISRVRHEMKKGERLGEFVARTLLPRASALSMSRDEVSKFCRQAERNRAEEWVPPPPTMFPEIKNPSVTGAVMVG